MLKRGPWFALSKVSAFATTLQSSSFGPPPAPEKQNVLPVWAHEYFMSRLD